MVAKLDSTTASVTPRSRPQRFRWPFKSSDWHLLAVGVIATCITTAIRIFEFSKPYWSDEYVSLNGASQPLANFFSQFWSIRDVSPPLYHILLRAWMTVFGNAPSATAALSLVISLVATWLMYRFGRVLFDQSTAITAALLFWNSYIVIHFSTETRMYMLVMTFALWSSLTFHRYFTTGSPRALRWYAVATLLGVYTHYQFWFLVLAQAFTAVFLQLTRRLPAPSRWWRAQLVVCLAWLPWMPFLIKWVYAHYFTGLDQWIEKLYPVTSWQYFFSVLHIFLYPTWTATWRTNLLVGWTLILVLVSLMLSVEYQRERWIVVKFRALEFPIVFPLILVALPLLLVCALNVGVYRYVVVAAPFFMVVLAAALVRLARRFRSTFIISAILFAITALNALAVLGWRLPF
ncbi:MAG: glycosyltransferase family 39 protein [Patescibacteria group bacterium]|nr:glycosyltransferase family 39 protein [Patescibacteria group bacterium]